jgi:hypothetical protein
LKVNQIILNKLRNEIKIVELYISIHFRNTDIKNKLKIFTNKIKIIVKRTNIKTVFLATDNAKTINAKLNVKNQHYVSTNKE